MRQVGDTLVWLGLIVVVAAVLYFTPRFASFFTARERDGLKAAADNVGPCRRETGAPPPVSSLRSSRRDEGG